MKFSIYSIIVIIIITSLVTSCSTSKKMQPTTKINEPIIIVDAKPISDSNSLKISYDYLHELKNNKINFQTFSGKAKVQFEDRNGRQPDANAIIRMAKDSIVWISLSSTFLNIEVIRILITPDTLIIINKLEKTVETYPYKYIRDIVQLPLTFSMLQDIIIGNPIFVGDSIKTSIISGNNILIETSDLFFQNLLTISTENHQLAKSQITESLQGNIRTATLEFNDYNTLEQRMFATFRSLKVENSSKIDCRISFREFEFNNELSFPFSIPGNYKTK